jgi:hypothetical protein
MMMAISIFTMLGVGSIAVVHASRKKAQETDNLIALGYDILY